jgi:hypothetical protein
MTTKTTVQKTPVCQYSEEKIVYTIENAHLFIS